MANEHGGTIGTMRMDLPPENCYALMVTATSGPHQHKAILKIYTDGRLWIDPDHYDEAAQNLLYFYMRLRHTCFDDLATDITQLAMTAAALNIEGGGKLYDEIKALVKKIKDLRSV